MKGRGASLWVIALALQGKGHRISHVAVSRAKGACLRSRVIVGALAVAATTLSMSTQIAHAQLGSTLSEFDCFSGTNRSFRFCPPLCLQAQTMDRATFERRRSENQNQRMTGIAETKAKM